jgi:hypothetical protein
MHIRGGDKIIEADVYPVENYFDKLNSNNIFKGNLFVLTDDYSIINYIKVKFKSFTIFTLCEENERGYDNIHFGASSIEFKKRSLLKLFASIEIVKKSNYFVGSLSSNPTLFISLMMENNCHSFVDTEKWKIF